MKPLSYGGFMPYCDWEDCNDPDCIYGDKYEDSYWDGVCSDEFCPVCHPEREY